MQNRPMMSGLLSLLSQPSLPPAQFQDAVRTMAASDMTRLVMELQRHGTLYQLLCHVEVHGAPREFDRSLMVSMRSAGMRRLWPEMEEATTATELLDRIERRMAAGLEDACRCMSGLEGVMLLKGAALRFVAPQYRRYRTDVEVYANSLGAAATLLRWLSNTGYRLVKRIMFGYLGTRPFACGQLLRGRFSLGVHAGAIPSISTCYPRPLELDPFEGAHRISSAWGEVTVPSVDSMLVMLIGHMVRHGCIKHKDVADYMVFELLGLDMLRVWDVLRRNGLHTFYELLSQRAEAFQGKGEANRKSLRHNVVGFFMDRGRRKGLTGSLVVQALCLMNMQRRRQQLDGATIGLVRLLLDQCFGRLPVFGARLRRHNERVWDRLMPENQRILSFPTLDSFLHWLPSPHTVANSPTRK